MRRNPVLAVKLKNAISRACPNIPVDMAIRNVRINGSAVGATGFATNKENGNCVWVSTDNACCQHAFVYRFAKNTSDHHGGINRWCDSLEELAANIAAMLAGSVPNELNRQP